MGIKEVSVRKLLLPPKMKHLKLTITLSPQEVIEKPNIVVDKIADAVGDVDGFYEGLGNTYEVSYDGMSDIYRVDLCLWVKE